jgi:hypothetical protein
MRCASQAEDFISDGRREVVRLYLYLIRPVVTAKPNLVAAELVAGNYLTD